MGYIGVILRLYRDNIREGIILGLCRGYIQTSTNLLTGFEQPGPGAGAIGGPSTSLV